MEILFEAQILGKPVVITAYPTAGSQLEDGVDGVIVPLDNAGCAEGIVSVLRDEKLKKRLQMNCESESFDGSAELGKLYALI